MNSVDQTDARKARAPRPRRVIRQPAVLPLLNAFREWLDEQSRKGAAQEPDWPGHFILRLQLLYRVDAGEITLDNAPRTDSVRLAVTYYRFPTSSASPRRG